MYLGSISENKAKEKRVAITPEMAKKYISLGVKLSLQRGFGTHLGFNDKDYSDLGVEILDNEKDVIKKVDVVVQLGLPDDEKLSLLKENQTLIGSLNSNSKEKLEKLKMKKLIVFHELLQKLQSTINGYLSSQATLLDIRLL